MQSYQEIVDEIRQDEPNFSASKGGTLHGDGLRIIGRCEQQGRDGIFSVLNKHRLLTRIECSQIGNERICGISKKVCANVIKTLRPEVVKGTVG